MGDLLARRTANIALNDQMFNEIFNNCTVLKEIKEVKRSRKLSYNAAIDQSAKASKTKHVEDEPELPVPSYTIEQIRNALKIKFILRNREINTITSYLQKDLLPSPPLLITGLTGLGKSSICNEAIALVNPYWGICKIDCSGYSQTRHFLGELWDRIATSFGSKIRKLQDEDINTNTSASNDSILKTQLKIALDSSPSDYCTFFHYLKYLFNYCIDDNYNKEKDYYLLCFDNIDHLNRFDSTMYLRLLQLGKECHGVIKVIAITQKRYTFTTIAAINLEMKPYNTNELYRVVMHMAEQKYLSKSTSNSMSISISSSTSTLTSTSTLVREHTKKDLELYSKILGDVLPVLTIRTRHPTEILVTSYDIFMNVNGHGDVVGDVRKYSSAEVCKLAAVSCKRPSTRLVTPNEYDFIPIGRGRDNNITTTTSSSNNSHWNGNGNYGMATQYSSSNTTSSNTTSVSSVINDDAVVVVSKSKGNDKWNLLSSSLRAANWIELLSQSAKFLLLSSYIASNNPSDTDSQIFGIKKKGRRPKRKLGGEEELSIEPDLSFHIFPLERMFSIFVQIVHQGKCPIADLREHLGAQNFHYIDPKKAVKIVEKKFGTVALFTLVNKLISDGHIAPTNSEVQNIFICNVKESEAEDIAKNVNFPLHSFLAR